MIGVVVMRFRAVALAVLAVVAAGCASAQTGTPIEVEGWIYPVSPVGSVIPVFVGIKCKPSCDGLPASDTPYIARADTYALNDAGKYVQALPLQDATAQSGGAEVLCDRLMGGMSAGQRAQHFHGAGAPEMLSMPGGAMIFPLGVLINMGAYAAASTPEFALQRIALAEATDSGGGSHSNDSGWRGWVFFPNGSYKAVRLDVMNSTDGMFTQGEARSFRTLNLPWTETFGPPLAARKNSDINSPN